MSAQNGRRLPSRLTRCPALVIAAPLFLLAGCGSADDNPVAPSPLAPASVTQEFSGEVEVQSSRVHPFPVSSRSTIAVTLVTVGPLDTLAVGLGVGTWDGTACTLVAADNNARQAAVLSGTVEPGNYCAAVFDNGNLTGTITYTVRVQRPE